MSRSLGALILMILCATTMQASIDVEGPQDSLAGAPTINHCTLRKAVINANTNTAAYPQCLSGVAGVDVVRGSRSRAARNGSVIWRAVGERVS